MSHVTLIGLLGLAAIAACWALAVLLYRVGTAGSTARMLSLLLVIEGVTLLTAGFPEFALGLVGLDIAYWDGLYGQYPALEMISSSAHHLGDAGMIALYPPFLALALQTNLVRPFAEKRIRMAVTATSVALFVGTMASFAIWESSVGSAFLYIAMMILFMFGLVVSLHAWYVAEPGVARDRARIFAIAFGIRDIGWGISYAVLFWVIWTDSSWMDYLVPTKLTYALGTLFAVPLIAYGILRTHLFDIDLRIRWTIKQSTVAAVFVAIFYIVSEGADRLLSSELGNIVGLVASALVVFFLVPLQRFAERVASAAMPNTENTPEYTMFRKLQVYEAALTEALPDGKISDRERELLNRLRDSLGISLSDANAIEGELQKGLSSFG
jgi:hypothetical protein